MEGVLTDYFSEPISGQPFYQRGAVVWVPSGFLLEKFVRLKAEHYNPAKQQHDYYTAQPMLPDDVFHHQDDLFHHLPVADQKLEANEEFAVNRYKLRKAIICSTLVEFRGLLPQDLKRLRIWVQGCFVVLPIYTLETEEKNPKYPVRFVERLKAYAYPQLFHLPRADKFDMRESAVRFDRVQVVHQDFMKPAKVRMTPDAMMLLEEWLRYYLFNELDENNGLIAAYRREALSKIGG